MAGQFKNQLVVTTSGAQEWKKITFKSSHAYTDESFELLIEPNGGFSCAKVMLSHADAVIGKGFGATGFVYKKATEKAVYLNLPAWTKVIISRTGYYVEPISIVNVTVDDESALTLLY